MLGQRLDIAFLGQVRSYRVTGVIKDAPANTKTLEALPDDSFNKQVLGDPEHFKRLIFMKDLDDDTRQKYLDLWQDVKTTFD